MGIPSTPQPVPPRNDAERAADATFYRREAARPRRSHGGGLSWLIGALVFLGFLS